ncbi:hypothetical protein FM110_06825 [Brachybacterium nesterenkovii]|uniref:Uncharacterized protein n=1 Tax=Brachybacterium nesterenkovii TaxID=47847 RepID=A0A1X6X095_9MICO|nr:hypothetical protein FM110_06825 [Brachybacterium nesterenkovii]
MRSTLPHHPPPLATPAPRFSRCDLESAGQRGGVKWSGFSCHAGPRGAGPPADHLIRPDDTAATCPAARRGRERIPWSSAVSALDRHVGASTDDRTVVRGGEGGGAEWMSLGDVWGAQRVAMRRPPRDVRGAQRGAMWRPVWGQRAERDRARSCGRRLRARQRPAGWAGRCDAVASRAASRRGQAQRYGALR